MIHTLIALGLIFAELSVLAFGGGNTILPEMQRQVVQVHGWMSAADFSALFALGQAAPGPNLMVVTLVGWHVAGGLGVLVTTIAKFGPSSVITVIALGLWERFKDRPWRGVIQAGIFPMTVGLVAASAANVTRTNRVTDNPVSRDDTVRPDPFYAPVPAPGSRLGRVFFLFQHESGG